MTKNFLKIDSFEVFLKLTKFYIFRPTLRKMLCVSDFHLLNFG